MLRGAWKAVEMEVGGIDGREAQVRKLAERFGG